MAEDLIGFCRYCGREGTTDRFEGCGCIPWPSPLPAMTPSQRAELAGLVREVVREDFFTGDGYEFKRLDVERAGRAISVYTITGLVDDEGTMAAIFGRDRRLVHIGPCGGLRACDGQHWHRGWRAKHVHYRI